jgi:hypothetical protein
LQLSSKKLQFILYPTEKNNNQWPATIWKGAHITNHQVNANQSHNVLLGQPLPKKKSEDKYCQACEEKGTQSLSWQWCKLVLAIMEHCMVVSQENKKSRTTISFSNPISHMCTVQHSWCREGLHYPQFCCVICSVFPCP